MPSETDVEKSGPSGEALSEPQGITTYRTDRLPNNIILCGGNKHRFLVVELFQGRYQVRRSLLLIIAVVIGYAATVAQAQEDSVWTWRLGTDPDSVKRSRAELDSLLEIHEFWLDTTSEKGQLLFLPGAHLEGADLTWAHLEWAHLGEAHLENADLWGAHLDGAGFALADLGGVRFEAVEPLPRISAIAYASNLNTLRYVIDPSSLVELREAFAEAGFKQQEREIICALRRHDAGLPEYVFFDLTSEYGSNLSRPWYIFIGLLVFCAIIYYLSMLRKTGSGVQLIVYRAEVGNASRMPPTGPDSEEKTRERLCGESVFIKQYRTGRLAKMPMFLRLVWWAFFFSTMSGFNIGFRDVNFGRWLKLLTRKRFDLRPLGWVRVVSGFQALISVYLIALWVLSFAGTPFK